MISDVFFDLDHTLWDFEKNSALAMKKVFEIHGIDISCDSFLEHYVPINFQYWERYRKDEITQDQLRYGRLKDTFVKLDCDVNDQTIANISTDYIKLLPNFNHLFEGAVELLEYLSPKYRLHIITNGFHEVQNIKLTKSGIYPYFQTITNSENAGRKKPHPVIFEYALKAANAHKESSIMIGDCIEADVRGALAFGMDAIHFCPTSDSHPNIKRVIHLSDIKNIL